MCGCHRIRARECGPYYSLYPRIPGPTLGRIGWPRCAARPEPPWLLPFSAAGASRNAGAAQAAAPADPRPPRRHRRRRQAHLRRGDARRLPQRGRATASSSRSTPSSPSDGVPVAIHDATLDRTTTCTGEVRSFTRGGAARAAASTCSAAPAAACRPARSSRAARSPRSPRCSSWPALTGVQGQPRDQEPADRPRLGHHLRLRQPRDGRRARLRPAALAAADPELHPGQPRRGQAAHAARAHQPAHARRPSPAEIEVARDKGYTWLSPQWPVQPRLRPRTPTARTSWSPPTRSTSAPTSGPPGRASVDALITDDPLMAAGALGLRPVKGLTAKLTRRGARVEVTGRLLVRARASAAPAP